MKAFKTFLVWLLLGVVVGTGVASWLAPGMAAWNNAPGDGQALCDCVKVTRSTAANIIQAQVIGAAAGAVLFLVLGFLISRRRPAAAPAALPTAGGAPGSTKPD